MKNLTKLESAGSSMLGAQEMAKIVGGVENIQETVVCTPNGNRTDYWYTPSGDIDCDFWQPCNQEQSAIDPG